MGEVLGVSLSRDIRYSTWISLLSLREAIKNNNNDKVVNSYSRLLKRYLSNTDITL